MGIFLIVERGGWIVGICFLWGVFFADDMDFAALVLKALLRFFN